MNDSTQEILKKCSNLLQDIKSKNPLIHHITNYVTINDCANVVIAIGGSPVMAMDKNEVEDIVRQADSLVINIGTLQESNIDSMIIAGKKANELKIPVVLDPVGIGATAFRYHTVQKLLTEIKFSVIKGNMSEIKKLYGLKVKTKGVDSDTDQMNGGVIAKNLANQLGTVVAITGKEDCISDGQDLYTILNGETMLTSITGTGCMTTSIIGTFLGLSNESVYAAIAGTMLMGIAGEKAHQLLRENEGSGSYKAKLMDCINLFNKDTYIKEGRLYVEKGSQSV
ncbi:hydroxyethylthiazole kinase [Natranaerovirga hydrolytica]|uniref:Hydroxyethylthiazole kinase n=1 Tax=Natranaerovirga hydrolytica TaxID=680378 RepID=A0A4R1N0R7_9FIRM|nr:hydroxyethylthiazole kinase [Natranaerovirga hydrolytica]TCK98492.1 hydroxyethylthiazole kinase [Natranaerovirga hydrolytica]